MHSGYSLRQSDPAKAYMLWQAQIRQAFLENNDDSFKAAQERNRMITKQVKTWTLLMMLDRNILSFQ
jgi:hypothetical protein